MSQPSIRERLSAIAKANKRQGGQKCAVCLLPRDVQTAIRLEREESGTSWPVLAISLRGIGHPVGESSLGNHFRERHEQRKG